MTLKYIGKAFLRGIPKRDLSDAEVEKHGGEEFLIGTGLYAREQQAPAAPVQRAKKSKPVMFDSSVADVTKGDEVLE